MNLLKISGLTLAGAGALTRADWMFVISVILTVLGMLQDYLKNRK